MSDVVGEFFSGVLESQILKTPALHTVQELKWQIWEKVE